MRLIDADKLRKDVLDMPNCYNGFSDTYDKSAIIGIIDEQPIVGLDEIIVAHEQIGYEKGSRDGYAEALTDKERHGHWGQYHIEGLKWICSECGSRFETPYEFCPHCGAKMDKNEWQESEINPCRDCVDYDGKGGCKSNGGCAQKIDKKEGKMKDKIWEIISPGYIVAYFVVTLPFWVMVFLEYFC